VFEKSEIPGTRVARTPCGSKWPWTKVGIRVRMLLPLADCCHPPCGFPARIIPIFVNPDGTGHSPNGDTDGTPHSPGWPRFCLPPPSQTCFSLLHLPESHLSLRPVAACGMANAVSWIAPVPYHWKGQQPMLITPREEGGASDTSAARAHDHVNSAQFSSKGEACHGE
jgi:hypothetical protein